MDLRGHAPLRSTTRSTTCPGARLWPRQRSRARSRWRARPGCWSRPRRRSGCCGSCRCWRRGCRRRSRGCRGGACSSRCGSCSCCRRRDGSCSSNSGCSCWRRCGRVSSCWSWCRCVSRCRGSRRSRGKRGCRCRRGSCCGCRCRRWRECSCWIRSGRWRRRWAGGRDINITLSAGRCTTGAVTEILSKKRVVSLQSACGRCVATSHRAPDHIKAILSLVQPQFVVSSRGGSSKVDCAPFDVEDPVGRSARHRGEDTAGSTRERRAAAVCIGALIVPVREDRVVMTGPR